MKSRILKLDLLKKRVGKVKLGKKAGKKVISERWKSVSISEKELKELFGISGDEYAFSHSHRDDGIGVDEISGNFVKTHEPTVTFTFCVKTSFEMKLEEEYSGPLT